MSLKPFKEKVMETAIDYKNRTGCTALHVGYIKGVAYSFDDEPIGDFKHGTQPTRRPSLDDLDKLSGAGRYWREYCR